MSQVVASRVFNLRGKSGDGSTIEISLGLPIVDPSSSADSINWLCPVGIRTPESTRVRPIYGVDSWQALELAMRIAPSFIDHHEAGMDDDSKAFLRSMRVEPLNPPTGR